VPVEHYSQNNETTHSANNYQWPTCPPKKELLLLIQLATDVAQWLMLSSDAAGFHVVFSKTLVLPK